MFIEWINTQSLFFEDYREVTLLSIYFTTLEVKASSVSLA